MSITTPIELALVDETSFSLHPTAGLAPQLLTFIRNLEGCQSVVKQGRPYGPEQFTIPLRHYDALVEQLQTHHADRSLVPIPTIVRQAICQAKPKTPTLMRHVPQQLLAKLYDYQRDGVRFAVARGGRCMIADEMGVGKSLQAIAVMAAYRAEWPALILCPSTLRGQWAELCETWFTDLERGPNGINVVMKSKDGLQGAINVVSYDLATRKSTELAHMGPMVAVVDESHFLKNRKSKRVQQLLPTLRRCRRILLLTGTPSLSRPSELFPQLHLLRSDLFSNFHRFGVRYCNARRNKWGWNYDGSSNLDELRVILHNTCMIRRTKHQVLQQLPHKTRERVLLEIADEQRALIQKSVDKIERVAHARQDDPMAEKQALMAMFRTTGLAKVPSVIEFVHETLQTEDKLLIFAHHQFVLDEIETYMYKKDVRFIRIDGKTPQKARPKLVDQFQEDGEIRVALLSITAAGVGLTLTAARTVIFAELFWTSGALLQAEDRVHRVGQTRDVFIKYLVAADTADETVWQIVSHKMAVLEKMLEQDGQRAGGDGGFRHSTRKSYDGSRIKQVDLRAFVRGILGTDNLPQLRPKSGRKRKQPAQMTLPVNWTPPALVLPEGLGGGRATNIPEKWKRQKE